MAKCKSLIFPFIVTSELSFVIEISYNKIYFYTSHGQLQNGSSIYSINSPYLYSDLYDENGISRIQYVQNGDIMYLFHEKYPVKKLSRLGNLNWTITDMEFIAPWDRPNTDESIKITASATDGTATLTASSALFNSNMVNKYLRLTEEDSSVKPWVTGTSYNTNDIVKSDSKQYIATNSGTSGTVKPVHTRGAVSDGTVKWLFKNAGYGVVKITAVTDSTHATATIIDSLPTAITSEGTSYFEWSIFSGKVNTYPMAGTFFRNRLCLLAQVNNVPTIYCSNSDDYENFADKDNGEVLATNAITIPLTNGSYNQACWIYGGDVLFAGTTAAEYVIDSAASGEAFAPDNSKCQIISEIGSLPIKPVKINSQVLFVARSGKEIKDIIYSFTTDAYETNSMSIQGRHLLESGIKDIAYQESPERTAWIMTENNLVGVTYSIEDKVIAFYRADLSGKVIRMAVIPSPINKLDELWVEVDRNDTTTIEWIDNNFIDYTEAEGIQNLDEQEVAKCKLMKNNSIYLDACVSGEFDYIPPTDDFNVGIDFSETFHAHIHSVTVTTNKGQTEKRYTLEHPVITATMTTGDLMNKGDTFSEVILEWVRSPLFDDNKIVLDMPDSLIGYQYDIYKNNIYIARGTITTSGISVVVPSQGEFGVLEAIKFHIFTPVDTGEYRTITGLYHLDGMEVGILADGAELEHQTVVNGSIQLPWKYRNITIGLPIKSEFIPQNIYIQGNNGSGVGDVQRIDHVTLMLWRSLGGKIGKKFSELNDIYFRKTDEVMSESAPLYTGNKRIPVNMNTSTIKEKGATVLIYNDSVFPMNILAIAPHFSTSGNGV